MGNNNQMAIIKNTVAAIKKYPRFDSPLDDEGLLGMVVKLLRTEGDGWFYIETHYGYNGYIHEKDIIIDTQRALDWQSKAIYYIGFGIVDVMAEPNYKNYPIELLTRGAFIQTTGTTSEEWTEIVLPEGKTGWVKSPYVKEMTNTSPRENEDELRKNLVATALTYLGTQYRWGGKSSLGIDCSGLCSMAYMLNGIIIYRDAVLKEEYMKSIDRKDIKPGDLLFFPGHVAMYIGEDKFVHSSSSEHGVVINSLNPSHHDYREKLDKTINGIGTIF